MEKNIDQPSLKNRSLSAVIWSFADFGIRHLFRLFIAIVLARLLEPEEFGTVALLYLFFGIAETFIDSGFSAALIQKTNATNTDKNTVFWFNFSTGAFFSLIFWFIAPYIAAFYEKPILVPLTRLMSFLPLLNSIGSIHNTLLVKSLNFKTPMQISVVSSFFSGIVSLTMALNGFGLWSLAFQDLSNSAMKTLLFWIFNAWRPKLQFSFASARSLFRFGAYLMFSRILDVAYSRSYSLLIGKLYGVKSLGFYSRGNNTMLIPQQILSGVLSRVSLPIFSAAAYDIQKLRSGVQYAIKSVMVINFSIMFGLIAVSDNLVEVIFGVKWIPAIPVLQVLCLAGAIGPLHIINLNVLTSLGHSNLFFRIEIIKKSIGIVFLIIGVHFGIVGVAWSQVINSFVSYFINSYYTRQLINYGPIKQIIDISPAFLAATLMAFLAFHLGQHINSNHLIVLIYQVSFGLLFMFTYCIIFMRDKFKDIISIVRFNLSKTF